MSASMTERMEACPSSHTKEMEVFYFQETHGIEGIEAGDLAQKGTRLHAILKEIPYHSPLMGYGDAHFKVGDALRDAARAHGLKLERGDFWFLYSTIQRRNLLIDRLISRVIEEHGGVTALEMNFDASRLRTLLEFSGDGLEVNFSGLPDVMVTATDGYGRRHVLVVDYKTGYAEQRDGLTNRQLTSLASLCAWQHQAVVSVGVSLIARNDDRPGEITLAVYREEELSQAKELVREVVLRSARLRAAYESWREAKPGQNDTPPPALEKKLVEEARVGDHCLHCKGKVACGAMRLAMRGFEKNIVENVEPLVQPLRTQFRIHAKKTIEEKLTLMKPEDLYLTLEVSRAVTEPAKLFASVREEAEELVRQLAKKGTSVDGTALKAGVSKLALREKALVPGSDGTLVERPLDTGPAAVFGAIKPLLPEMAFHEFVGLACEVNPGSVREILSDLYKVDKKEVFVKVLANLGPENPFEMRANNPTVVLVPKGVATNAPSTEMVSAPPAQPGALEGVKGAGEGGELTAKKPVRKGK